MKIQESAEMYMEAILVLAKESEHVRAIDIVNYLNYSKPSVSRAMKSLKVEGFIDIDINGFITLSKKGLSIAKKVYEKHQVLHAIFIKLGVSQEIAMDDACKIEHVISDETFEKIKAYLENK